MASEPKPSEVNFHAFAAVEKRKVTLCAWHHQSAGVGGLSIDLSMSRENARSLGALLIRLADSMPDEPREASADDLGIAA